MACVNYGSVYFLIRLHSIEGWEITEILPAIEAVVKIEDTISDIQEGLNAGMWTIEITRSANELGLTKQQADQLEPSDSKQRL